MFSPIRHNTCLIFCEHNSTTTPAHKPLQRHNIIMADKCHRSGKAIYAADNPIRIGKLVFLPGHFTCAATGTKLTMKNYVIANGDVYLQGKEPELKPTQVASTVMTESVKAVQKHEVKKFTNLGDEKFTPVASDPHTEHAKSVQKHEVKKFAVLGDEKFTQVAGIHDSHVASVQMHEKKQFAVGERQPAAN